MMKHPHESLTLHLFQGHISRSEAPPHPHIYPEKRNDKNDRYTRFKYYRHLQLNSLASCFNSSSFTLRVHYIILTQLNSDHVNTTHYLSLLWEFCSPQLSLGFKWSRKAEWTSIPSLFTLNNIKTLRNFLRHLIYE